nr:uncharacterized protein I303_06641 [Kwoniella dejecticola CBS 10117]OBR83082.1 hypothetical protein I303_06641 [Kwoniella dejecticola CBS 10117]
MSESGIPPKDDPLPTVYNLLTFWKIIITSEPPIVGTKLSMGGDKRLAANGFGIPPTSYQHKGKDRQPKDPKGKQKQKKKEVWVDVIAQGGKEWKRIYSKKISHLLAEFREADSYINSDYDSESESGSASSSSSSSVARHHGNPQSRPQPGMDNSLVSTAKDLLRAAEKVDRIPGAPVPQITIHLTRIPSSPRDLSGHDSDEWPDDRIPRSFDLIRSLGVNLVFGDLSDIPLSALNGPEIPSEPIPSLRFNLDITTLMGLCSDVLHYPLPRNKEEAAQRSLRPPDKVSENPKGQEFTGRGRDGTGKGNGKAKKEEIEEEFRGQSQNSIELYRCILEEMERPFIDEFNEIIEEAWEYRKQEKEHTESGSVGAAIEGVSDLKLEAGKEERRPEVEFWTTQEAAQYTYEALSSGPAHGEGQEQRRMRIMLGLEEGDFFLGSRYKDNERYLRDFRIRIFGLEGTGEKFRPKGVSQVLEAARTYAAGVKLLSSASNSPNGSKTELGSQLDRTGQTKERGKTGLHHTLYSINGVFLNQYYTSLLPLHNNSNQEKSTTTSTSTTNQDQDQKTTSKDMDKNKNKITSQQIANLPNFLHPRKLPTPPIAKISLPFPVVSLHSLNRGAKEGMTTIMMGTATLKEVWGQSAWRVRGWERGWYNWDNVESTTTENTTIRGGDKDNDNDNVDAGGAEGGRREREQGSATVIIFPYRVFGEGKRVRFAKGDYSYPTKEWWDDQETVLTPITSSNASVN